MNDNLTGNVFFIANLVRLSSYSIESALMLLGRWSIEHTHWCEIGQ